jgi:hypothetical protein
MAPIILSIFAMILHLGRVISELDVGGHLNQTVKFLCISKYG